MIAHQYITLQANDHPLTLYATELHVDKPRCKLMINVERSQTRWGDDCPPTRSYAMAYLCRPVVCRWLIIVLHFGVSVIDCHLALWCVIDCHLALWGVGDWLSSCTLVYWWLIIMYFGVSVIDLALWCVGDWSLSCILVCRWLIIILNFGVSVIGYHLALWCVGNWSLSLHFGVSVIDNYLELWYVGKRIILELSVSLNDGYHGFVVWR